MVTDSVARDDGAPARAAMPGGIGQWLAPPRFLLFIALFAGGAWLWRALGHTLADSLDLGFDGAALVFLISLAPLFRQRCDSAAMRQQAARNDANRVVVLGITTLLTVVIMAAIAGELPHVGHGAAGSRAIALAKVIGTLMLTWLFANMVYALHYAHLYYSADETIDGEAGADRCGLDIPGGEDPDYLDFVYFAFTLGMTFQTADVNITGKAIRRIAILHGFAA